MNNNLSNDLEEYIKSYELPENAILISTTSKTPCTLIRDENGAIIPIIKNTDKSNKLNIPEKDSLYSMMNQPVTTAKKKTKTSVNMINNNDRAFVLSDKKADAFLKQDNTNFTRLMEKFNKHTK